MLNLVQRTRAGIIFITLSTSRMVPPAMPARARRKSYDEAYFTKWYRDPRTRVHTPDAVQRKIRMVVGVTEYFLGRKLRSVLDIGAGEGTWGVEIRRMRPGVRYLGVDPSDYVVAKHGKRRNIRKGSFEELPDLKVGGDYDLIVCADMLQYIADAPLKRGIAQLAGLLSGVAFLEAYTTGDEMEGDLEDWHPRSKARYRRIFAEVGLVPCGVHCYLTPSVARNAVELELV
jgi:SAM-dependent methyltransferase